MRAILLSNIPHYHHLAVALHEAGWLERYITATTLIGDEPAPRYLPAFWRKKLEGRRIWGVPRERVISITAPEFLQRLLPMGRLISEERGNWINNHSFDFLARKFIDDCDVLHFVSSVGLHCAQRAKQLGAQVVCDVRQEHPAFQTRMIREEARLLNVPAITHGSSFEQKVLHEFSLADWLVVPSVHAKRTFLEQGFAADRIAVLPYGVDLTMFRPAPRQSNVFRVLYAGQITLRKGLHYLLDAWKQLRLPNAELTLAGTIDPHYRPVLARYEGLFTYLGPLPKTELYRLYAESSVFVLPSLADSFALAALEAMACGLPVIVSRNTGAADLITERRQGFVVPIRDSATIAERLLELSENEDLRRAMSISASEAARRQSWAEYGRQANAFYRQAFCGAEMAQSIS